MEVNIASHCGIIEEKIEYTKMEVVRQFGAENITGGNSVW
jgi:hypothetical protein